MRYKGKHKKNEKEKLISQIYRSVSNKTWGKKKTCESHNKDFPTHPT